MDFDFQALADNIVLGLTTEKRGANGRFLSVGKTTNIGFLFVDIFEKWTQHIDNTNLSLHDSIYYRGFTLQEYYQLFDESIKDYYLYPAFRFLMIECERGYHNGERRIYGRKDYTDMYEKSVDGFIQCMNDRGKHILDYFNKEKIRNTINFNEIAKHVAIGGGTGRGKSGFIWYLWYAVSKRLPFPHIVIDPHGELSENIFKTKIKGMRKVWLRLDLQKGYTYTINLLDIPNRDEETIRFASGNIIDVLNEVIDGEVSDAQTPMLQHVVEFLLRRKGSTMNDFLRLLNVEQDILVEAQQFRPAYFNEVFLKGEVGRTRNALYNRFDGFLNNISLRPVLMGESTIRIKDLLKRKTTTLFDMSRFPSGADRERITKIVATCVKNAMFERGYRDVMPVLKWIDEAPSSQFGSLEEYLSQMRKFKCFVILAFQYIDQFRDPRDIKAIKENVGVKIGASKRPSSLRKYMNVPNRMITSSSDQEDEGVIKLGKYEFIIDTLYSNARTFKVPSKLYKEKNWLKEEVILEKIEKNISRYYRSYFRVEEKPKREIKNDLFLTGSTEFEPSPIILPKDNKGQNLRHCLGLYKFLTVRQMVKLGIAASPPNIPTAAEERAGYIGSIRKKTKVYYLKKKGVDFLKSEGATQINAPTKKVDDIPNFEHNMILVDHQIEYSKMGMIMCSKDTDNSGVQHKRATRIGNVESDMIFILQTPKQKELYLVEVERTTSHDSTYQKFLTHKELILSGAANKMLDFDRDYRVIFIFDNPRKLEVIQSRVKKEEQLHEHFLFKMADDDYFNGYINCLGQKRTLFTH